MVAVFVETVDLKGSFKQSTTFTMDVELVDENTTIPIPSKATNKGVISFTSAPIGTVGQAMKTVLGMADKIEEKAYLQKCETLVIGLIGKR